MSERRSEKEGKMLGNRCITECRKFSPNIFNKNKCTLCFGKREEHNPSALDYNRVSRPLTYKLDKRKKTKDDQRQRLFVFYVFGKAQNSHKNYYCEIPIRNLWALVWEAYRCSWENSLHKRAGALENILCLCAKIKYQQTGRGEVKHFRPNIFKRPSKQAIKQLSERLVRLVERRALAAVSE